MADKTWTFELEKVQRSGEAERGFFSSWCATHTVSLRHNYLTAKRTIYLNGNLVPADQIRSYGIYGVRSDDLFVVGGHTYLVHIRSNGIVYNYDLAIDGVSVQTGQPVDVPPEV